MAVIFGLQQKKLKLYTSKDKQSEIEENSTKDVVSLHGSTLYAYV